MSCGAVVNASPAIVGASERCSASCVDGSHYADHEIKLKVHTKRGVAEDDHNDFYHNDCSNWHSYNHRCCACGKATCEVFSAELKIMKCIEFSSTG